MALPIVLYDGDCAFCSSAVRFAQKYIAHQIQFAAFQQTELNKYGLSTTRCQESLKFINHAGEIYSAQDAIAELLISAKRGWKLIGIALKLPGINFIAALGYKLVAANRHRLPGGTPTCKLD